MEDGGITFISVSYTHLVYLTKNGRGRFVVMDIEDYERGRAEKKLLLKLQEAEEAVKDGEGWLDLDELKALVGE